MIGIGRLDAVVFDAVDIDTLATFYVELTGWTIHRKDTNRITLEAPFGPLVAFQRAPEHIPPQWPGQEYPQQFHLDLDVAVDGLAGAADKAISLGATKLAEGPHWVTVADPAGHPLDLAMTSSFAPMSTLWAHIDAPDTSALARFYSALLGMEITHDDETAAEIVEGDWRVVFQPVSDYNPPRWPDPDFPQQGHLDVRVDDLTTAEAQVLALGGTRLSRGDDALRVFADPAGHPFCLVA